MGRRRPGKKLAGAWECPGGKFEAQTDGDIFATLEREYREELGVRIAPRGATWRVLHVSRIELATTMVVQLIPTVLLDEPTTLVDHDLIDWVIPEVASRELACTPAFYVQYKVIVDYARRAARA